ncbi:MAG TPA: phospholipase D-like domain-containing protein, partial [Ramlibacter sp.]|nr:phospholipase D-like domain-containing protein [Ramlibacter sp.]
MVVLFWLGLLLALVVVLAIAIWSIRRHRDPVLQVECDAPIEALVSSLAGLTLSTAVPGNSAQVLENGAFFDILLERIRAARRTIHFETFLWKDGVLGRRLADALCERARNGVKVRVLLDAQGARYIGDSARTQMRLAGCELRFFHKRSLRNLGVLNDRDHRKL